MAATLRAFRPLTLRIPILTRALGSAPSRKATPSTSSQDAAPTTKAEKSRWQLLKAARKAAPPPKRRKPKGASEAPPAPQGEIGLAAAIDYVRTSTWAKFDETVELAVRLNVDPRVSTQIVRTYAFLPHGTGKRSKVAILDGEDWNDYVGSTNLLRETIAAKGRNLKDVRVAIAPKYGVSEVAKRAGRALGPRGLLPHEKDGTVIRGDLVEAAEKMATQWVRLRVDRGANVHARVGCVSMDAMHIRDNVLEVMKRILLARPPGVKRKYVLNASMSSSMGRSVRLDLEALARETRAYESKMEIL